MAKSKSKPKIEKDLTFEQGIDQLESIMERVESGEVGLEESIAEYERGMELITHCRAVLDRCEQRVEELTKQLAAAPAALDTKPADSSAGEEPST
ncbi:MAG: exodeoxyribonuclease VII small subunit [Phycisphaerales bacterium]|nr:exodeoxyribonuclease VII small subunit [Phycisphaerales bacterium]